MLESLNIQNYAIIDEMTVDFSDGLNVITGETGAGKSIVVDAFELVLGARASLEMIRSGADSLSVLGVFFVEGMTLPVDLPYEADDGRYILRRDVRSDGVGRCFINDRPVTLKSLKHLGTLLADLHGQHDHQSLLNVQEHVTFLDGYGSSAKLAREVAQLFTDLVSNRKAINDLKLKLQHLSRESELQRFQIEEIESARIAPGEDVHLSREIQRISRANELKTLGLEIFQELYEADDSVGEHLGDLTARASALSRYDPGLETFVTRFEEVSVVVSDLANMFREYAEKIDEDSSTLSQLEDRLALIERIKKKYGPTLDKVILYLEEIRKETEGMEKYEEQLDEYHRRQGEIESQLIERATELSAKRAETAPLLSREVEGHLRQLGMEGARLVIAIEPFSGSDFLEIEGRHIPVGVDGFDRVEFMISANFGESPKPLVKVASGGEISRIMLTLKLVLLDAANVPTMVFDEIDIGVSGRVADAIGNKMLELSQSRQLLVITHLPQIAVKANRHFSARKSVKDGRTYTELVVLDEEAREKELAAFLSGETLTDTALAHARRLMDRDKNVTGSEENPGDDR